MNSPLISVIIPFYNAEKYLNQCMSSVINQTYNNIEVIMIDDGSTDKSLIIANQYISEKVTVFSQNNRGASAARNLGLSKAKGTYIQFLDADDFISLNKIESQLKIGLANPNKIIGCQTIHFYAEEVPLNKFSEPLIDELMFSYNTPINFLTNLWGGYDGIIKMVQPNAWLCPYHIITKAGLWNEDLSLDDDGEYFCRLILNSEGVVFDDSSTNFYRKYNKSKSVSGGIDKIALKSQLKALMLKKKYLYNFSLNSSAKVALANLYLSLAFISFQRNAEIFQIASNELKNLDVKPNLKIDLGGKFINFIGSILGWKAARRLSIWKASLKKLTN